MRSRIIFSTRNCGLVPWMSRAALSVRFAMVSSPAAHAPPTARRPEARAQTRGEDNVRVGVASVVLLACPGPAAGFGAAASSFELLPSPTPVARRPLLLPRRVLLYSSSSSAASPVRLVVRCVVRCVVCYVGVVRCNVLCSLLVLSSLSLSRRGLSLLSLLVLSSHSLVASLFSLFLCSRRALSSHFSSLASRALCSPLCSRSLCSRSSLSARALSARALFSRSLLLKRRVGGAPFGGGSGSSGAAASAHSVGRTAPRGGGVSLVHPPHQRRHDNTMP